MVEKLLVGVFVVCLIFVRHYFTKPARMEKPPAIITFEADLGPVTFYHTKHQQYLKENCVLCHHKNKENIYACRKCHKKKKDTVEGDPISFYDVKMNLCRGCHQRYLEQDTSSKAPIHCNECHDVKKIKWSR